MPAVSGERARSALYRALQPRARLWLAATVVAGLFGAPGAVAEEPSVTAAGTATETATLVPKLAPAPARGAAAFAADPVSDGAIIVGAAAFAGILDLINGTGEVRPQQISPTFERSQLLGIDRGAILQAVDPHARTYSNIGLATAVGYALLDPILSGVREQSVQAGLVEALIYAEAMSLTWGVTNLTKIAVRRPRPRAYIDAVAHRGDPTYSASDTDSSLSFFSGHASLTASIAATATYLAFVRSPGTPSPWFTLGASVALTTFVSVERVRAGAHFPTDVIAGAIAGSGIAVLVAHLHRNEQAEPRRFWLGFAPEGSGGGSIQAGGAF
jgi:membrane-associated phospholipid phosphatase